MEAFAREFGDYVAAISIVMGVVLIAALILLALSRVTLPTLRHLWHRASISMRIIKFGYGAERTINGPCTIK